MKIFFCLSIFLFVSVFSFGTAFCQNKKLSYSDSAGVMPSFRFYSTDGVLFTPDSLNKQNNSVLIYMKTDCPYCEKEAEMISKNISEFKSVDFIFISRADTSSIRQFAEKYKLEKIGNVRFLRDKEKIYYKFYTASYTPSIHIYDRNKKLKSFTEGFLSKDELLKAVQ